MIKLSFRNKLGISLAILCGKTFGRFGPTTVCTGFVHVDGSAAYHKPSWVLDAASGQAECTGTVRISNK